MMCLSGCLKSSGPRIERFVICFGFGALAEPRPAPFNESRKFLEELGHAQGEA